MKTVFQNVNLLDGTLNEQGEMELREGVSVVIEGDTIVGVYEGKAPETAGAQIIDLTGKTMLPGLINLHVHLASSGKPPKANAKPVNYKKLFDTLSAIKPAMAVFKSMEKGLAKKHLLSGVTTIRTVGGVMDHDGQIRDEIKAGKAVGPRILCSNTAVSVPGGHFAGSLATEAETPEMAAEHVEKIAATNPDWIKLMITGGVMDASAEGEPGVLRMQPELIRAACDKAHSLGYKVAAHIESPEGVLAALENGVDTVEHGAVPDERMISLFKERGAAAICTISPAVPYVKLPEEISHCGDLGRANGKIVTHGIIECAKRCLAAGVPVGLGNDAGCNFVTPFDFWRELYYFSRYVGVSHAFAIHTATLGNAKLLGMENEIGSVETGKKADLLVVNGNPLESFDALRTPFMVVTGGKIIKQPKLKKRKDVETALDSLM